MGKKFYITTTLPYVNSDPHIGFAMEIIRADTIARAKALQGYEVFFNTGTDEHGAKVYQNAVAKGQTPQEYADGFAKKFKQLDSVLGLATDVSGITFNFIRTTDAHHVAAAQEFWRKCLAKGDIYKKNYTIKYCTGCELEKTDSELNEAGQCLLHPNLQIEIREEENYFFKFSNYQKYLLDFYASHPNFVLPESRMHEISRFVERRLQDFSISRLKSKMPWGVAVPGDDTQVMYVWFDALVNYISAVGWPENAESFKKWWIDAETVQYAGKDNLRQQSAMWQAMLASADLPHSQQIIIEGFINAEGGVKMSKSLGNGVDPFELVKEYGIDALRYFVLRELPSFDDGIFTTERFKEAYNANLANGIGNLTARIMKMASDNLSEPVVISEFEDMSEYFSYLANFDITKAADFVWRKIGDMDLIIQKAEPFKLVKTDPEKGKQMISELVVNLYSIARMLNPMLPETSKKIKQAIKENKMPETLFPRKD